MYKSMIIEDEQIERETLYKIIQEVFRMSELYAAKMVKSTDLFEEHHPDIILADINIQVIMVWRRCRIRQTAGKWSF